MNAMPTTRTPGITFDSEGNCFIDKRHRGVRICARLGHATVEQAEQLLRREVDQVDIELAR